MKDVNLLKQALPYIRKYKNKIFVVKMGGQVAQNKEQLEKLAEDISLLHQVGIKIVVIHGGGPQASDLCEKLGHKSEMVNGRRVTTDEVLEVAKMVYAGKINVEILSALLRHGSKAVGVSGVDGGLIKARKRKPVVVQNDETGTEQIVDYGHVGDIVDINASILNTLLQNDYIPVVSSLGADEDGNIFNINADTVAASIAIELQAEKFINMTSVNGILKNVDEKSSIISCIPEGEVSSLIDQKIIKGGMLPKVKSCVDAVKNGVKRAHILNGLTESALLLEVFTQKGTGTMIMLEDEYKIYHESIKEI